MGKAEGDIVDIRCMVKTLSIADLVEEKLLSFARHVFSKTALTVLENTHKDNSGPLFTLLFGRTLWMLDIGG